MSLLYLLLDGTATTRPRPAGMSDAQTTPPPVSGSGRQEPRITGVGSSG